MYFGLVSDLCSGRLLNNILVLNFFRLSIPDQVAYSEKTIEVKNLIDVGPFVKKVITVGKGFSCRAYSWLLWFFDISREPRTSITLRHVTRALASGLGFEVHVWTTRPR